LGAFPLSENEMFGPAQTALSDIKADTGSLEKVLVGSRDRD